MRKVLGLDAFDRLRQKGLFYADKTRHLYRLAASEEPSFLSRPPGFGKTILASSFDALLRGRRELFQGLWIDGSDYDFRPRPVISLRLDRNEPESAADLAKHLKALVYLTAEIEDLELGEKSPGKALERLIKGMSDKRGRKAAVIVDGYDGPVITNIFEPALAKDLSLVLEDFMEGLERARDYLGAVLVTGATRLKNVVAKSGPGFLQDLTLDERYADICGFTAEDFGGFYALNPRDPEGARRKRGPIEKFSERVGLPQGTAAGEILEKVQADYGGYSWDGQTRLLRPDLADTIADWPEHYRYRISSKAIEPLTALLTNSWQIHEVAASEAPLTKEANIVDLDDISPAALFFQLGFLTVGGADQSQGSSKFRLGFPNPEAESVIFQEAFGVFWLEIWRERSRACGEAIVKALALHSAPDLLKALGKLEELFLDRLPTPEKGFRQTLLLMALAAAGQRFDRAGPFGDEVFFGVLNAENKPGLVIKTEAANEEAVVRWPGLSPLTIYRPYKEVREAQLEAAGEAMSRIEEMRSGLSFKDEPGEIYKCALVFSDFSRTLAVFEKAGHWRLWPKGPGRYEVE
jgi:hypothetical protein